MPYDDAVIQWWEQVHVNHVFSVEQLSTANLMKSNLKWSYDKQNLTLLNTSTFFNFCWNATPEYDTLLLNMCNLGFVEALEGPILYISFALFMNIIFFFFFKC